MRHQLSPAAQAQATIALCALESWLAREVAMNSPLVAVLIVVVLIVGSTLDHEQGLQERLSLVVRPDVYGAASY